MTYTGDTEWTDAIIEAADGADVLVCECCFYDKPVRTHIELSVLQDAPREDQRAIGRADAYGAQYAGTC